MSIKIKGLAVWQGTSGSQSPESFPIAVCLMLPAAVRTGFSCRVSARMIIELQDA